MNGARAFFAALLFLAMAAQAQEAPEGAPVAADDEEPMPAVDTSAAASGAATDEIVLESTEITGNRELPKVLYIVPWQKSDPGALMGRPANTLLDEVLAPLDREEFLRQVDYYSDLYGNAAGPEPEPAQAAGTGD